MNVEELSTVRRASQTLKLVLESVGQMIQAVKLPAEETGHRIKLPDLESLRRDLEAVLQHLEESANEEIAATVDEKRREVCEALEEVYQECRKANWDGYGAKALSASGYSEAMRFCQLLPSSVPAPEVSADPDGEIAFEWNEGPRHVFSVSVGCNNELTYAGIFGKSRAHGVEYFGDEFPQAILREVNRVFSQGS